MAEYIEREAAVKRLIYLCELREKDLLTSPLRNKDERRQYLKKLLDDEYLRGVREAAMEIESGDIIPSADVQPARYGKWLISSDGYYPYCSECKERPDGKLTDFCPHCGAKMKNEGENLPILRG